MKKGLEKLAFTAADMARNPPFLSSAISRSGLGYGIVQSAISSQSPVIDKNYYQPAW
jgi:hypothetical protein